MSSVYLLQCVVQWGTDILGVVMEVGTNGIYETIFLFVCFVNIIFITCVGKTFKNKRGIVL